MWSVVGFFLGPIGRLVGIALIALAALGWAYTKGAASATARCDAAALRAELAAARADLDAAKRAASEAETIGAKLRAAEAKNTELSHELSKRPAADACRLDDGDVRGLRSIK
jgi:hypothetical protein